MLTPERIAEIEARVNGATKGPWQHDSYITVFGKYYVHHGERVTMEELLQVKLLPINTFYKPFIESVFQGDKRQAKANIEFCANARQDVPDLLADRKQLFEKIEQLEADNQKLRKALKPFADTWHAPLCMRPTASDYYSAAQTLAETEAK